MWWDPYSGMQIVFGNFFGNMFQFSGFSRLLKNPLALFVYTLLSKWYVYVMVTAIIVTYYVFKGLEQAGVLQEAWTVVTTALDETKSIAQNCVPKILNLGEFWDCLENPPEYKPSEYDAALQKQFESMTSPQSTPTNQDPYAQ